MRIGREEGRNEGTDLGAASREGAAEAAEHGGISRVADSGDADRVEDGDLLERVGGAEADGEEVDATPDTVGHLLGGVADTVALGRKVRRGRGERKGTNLFDGIAEADVNGDELDEVGAVGDGNTTTPVGLLSPHWRNGKLAGEKLFFIVSGNKQEGGVLVRDWLS